MGDTTITVTQIVNYIGGFSKKRPFWAATIGVLTSISIVGGIWWTSVQLYSYYTNLIYRDKIYLSLAETGRKVKLNQDYQVVRPINPMKENTPTVLRFKLEQHNTNAPTITKIALTFPPDVIENSIKSLPAENGWKWTRTSDPGISYYLDYPTNDPPAKSDGGYWLPAFSAAFKNVSNLTFQYYIIANKMEPIDRIFILDANPQQSDTFTTTIFASGNNANSVTPNTVSVTPPKPIGVYIQGDLPTVTPDSETKKK